MRRLWFPEPNLEYFFVQMYSNQFRLKFSATVAASLLISSSETVLELKSDSPVDLFMILGLKPKSIIHNGMSVKNWKYDANSKILTLTIPKGLSKITIN